jgi:hypothetical protein
MNLDSDRGTRNPYLGALIASRLEGDFDDTKAWFRRPDSVSVQPWRVVTISREMPTVNVAQSEAEFKSRLTDCIQKLHDEMNDIMAWHPDVMPYVGSINAFVILYADHSFTLTCEVQMFKRT